MLVREAVHDLCNLLKPYKHLLFFTGANQEGEGEGDVGSVKGGRGALIRFQLSSDFRSCWTGDTYFGQSYTKRKSVAL